MTFNRGDAMTGIQKQTISAEVPRSLVRKVDALAKDLDRSKSWLIREALTNLIHNYERRHQEILKGLEDVRAGRTISNDEMQDFVRALKASR